MSMSVSVMRPGNTLRRFYEHLFRTSTSRYVRSIVSSYTAVYAMNVAVEISELFIHWLQAQLNIS